MKLEDKIRIRRLIEAARRDVSLSIALTEQAREAARCAENLSRTAIALLDAEKPS